MTVMTVRHTTTFVVLALAVGGCGSAPGGPTVLADGYQRAVAAAVAAVTRFPTRLDPRLFDGMQLKPDVRKATLTMVDRVLADTGITGVEVQAVELYGSEASYEYDDHSDFGVHVFATSASMPAEQLAPVLRLLNDDVERRQEGQLRFYGVPVELTFHQERTENYRPVPGIGQYSISEDRWLIPPVQQADNFDRSRMVTDMGRFINAYNDLVTDYQHRPLGFDCSRFDELDQQMADFRNTWFTAGRGSRSTENLTYRALRRLNVSIPDMVDVLGDECLFRTESVGP